MHRAEPRRRRGHASTWGTRVMRRVVEHVVIGVLVAVALYHLGLGNAKTSPALERPSPQRNDLALRPEARALEKERGRPAEDLVTELKNHLATVKAQVTELKERQAEEHRGRRQAEALAAAARERLAGEQSHRHKAEAGLATLRQDRAEEQKRRRQVEALLATLKDRLAREQSKRQQVEALVAAAKQSQEQGRTARSTPASSRSRTYYSGVTRNGGERVSRD